MIPLLAALTETKIQKSYFGETRRIVPPRETFQRVSKLFPIFGLTRVANVTGLDKVGIPVYTACRPNARSLSVSQGKGYTDDAARVSAVMESIESWHAETIQNPLRLCGYEDLYFAKNVIDAGRLPRPTNSFFTPHQRLLWIEGVDLFTHQSRWVPYETVHADYRDPLPEGHGCFIPSSNGLASGNSHHEAIIHALCEVIERDALTLWSRKSDADQAASKIDVATITDERVLDILARFEAAGIYAGIWEITSDAGTPSFLCRIVPKLEPDMSGQRPASGMGCHLSRDIALLRAVTEAAQSRLTFISGARDDMSRKDYERFLSQEEYLTWHRLITAAGGRDYRQIVSVETDTLDGDIAVLLDQLHRVGIREAVVVDLSKPQLGIPVVRVIVPGLESFPSAINMLLGERAGRGLTYEE